MPSQRTIERREAKTASFYFQILNLVGELALGGGVWVDDELGLAADTADARVPHVRQEFSRTVELQPNLDVLEGA